MHRNRIADLQLRGNTSPLPVRVYWPRRPVTRPVPLLVFCRVGAGAAAVAEADCGAEADWGAEAACQRFSQGAGLVVLSVCCEAGVPDGTAVLEWAAEHAAEIGADPGRLLVAGEGAGAAVAAAVAAEALAAGWPSVTYVSGDEFPGPTSSDSMNKSTEEK
jgi:acetyl esterase